MLSFGVTVSFPCPYYFPGEVFTREKEDGSDNEEEVPATTTMMMESLQMSSTITDASSSTPDGDDIAPQPVSRPPEELIRWEIIGGTHTRHH